MLNEFFTPITGIIFEHNGTIDKYVGDMVMAFWNAPLLDANHAEHAIDAALSMLQKVEELKPVFAAKAFHISPVYAGMTAGCFAVMNLFARPSGGLFSDAYGRRKILMICLIGQTLGIKDALEMHVRR